MIVTGWARVTGYIPVEGGGDYFFDPPTTPKTGRVFYNV